MERVTNVLLFWRVKAARRKENHMTRFKKILATVLTVATTASMSMTAFAADASTAVTGITTADRSIPYTRYVDVGNSTSTFFEVTGMTSDYQREYLSKDEAGKVSWTVTSLSDTMEGQKDNIKITKSAREISAVDEEYVARADIDFKDVEQPAYGYAVIQAKLDGIASPTLDFAIVFNPAQDVSAAGQVTCIFNGFNEGTQTVSNVTVPQNREAVNMAKYPNALSATMQAAQKKGDIVVNLNGDYIESISFNGTGYPAKGQNGYWEYKLYAGEVSEENFVEASADLGAGVVPISSNYTVVWNYTSY
jgi:hypothetical protein